MSPRRSPTARRSTGPAAGFALTALSVVGVALAFRGGGDDGALFHKAYAGVGAGLALGFSPTLTGAPAAVRPEDAADTSGLPATVSRLGQPIGVAVFGTLFSNRLESLGARRRIPLRRRSRSARTR